MPILYRPGATLLSTAALGAVIACVRTSQQQQSHTDGGTVALGGADASTDAGSDSSPDAAQAALSTCPPDAVPPTDGGIAWSAGPQASVAAAQLTQWISVSSDPECASIEPGPVPPELSWTGPDASKWAPWCDAPLIDGKGNLSVSSIADVPGSDGVRVITTLLPADGSTGAVLTDGPREHRYGFTPRGEGFVLLSGLPDPAWYCEFVRPVTALGTASGQAVVLDVGDPDMVEAIVPNPAGGFVEVRVLNYFGVLQLRWVDEQLKPVGNWHDVVRWKYNNDFSVWLDQKGKALVLSFIYPPSFGAPDPPSEWTFTARWVDIDGPIGEAFEPVAPVYTASNGTALFAGWGTILSLPDGGFAMFHEPAPSWAAGTTAPIGWYAAYPSGQSAVGAPPSWLQQYDGSLGVVAGGRAYAALQHDAQTCARTALLISPSGRTCFKLPVDNSAACDVHDGIDPGGTLVLQHSCDIHWWPLIARPQ